MRAPSRVASALLALAGVILTSCQGSTVQVDAYPTTKGSELDCRGMLNDLPPSVADEERRTVEGRLAGAWGDPPIVLRCGVEKPAALKPTSSCHDVNGVGWLAEQQPDGWLFTTIGRALYVSVEVPAEHEPAADALADLADVIGRHVPVTRPCV